MVRLLIQAVKQAVTPQFAVPKSPNNKFSRMAAHFKLQAGLVGRDLLIKE